MFEEMEARKTMDEDLTFEKMLITFHRYLAQDDCVEVIQTSRGYAVIEWDDRLESWTGIEHCPSPAKLHEILLAHAASFLEYGFTSGSRELTDEERKDIEKQQNTIIVY